MDQTQVTGRVAPGRGQRLRRAGAVLAFLAFSAGALWFQYDPKLDLNGDNVTYLLLGRALAQGKGYVEIQSPGSPQHRTYPPGYPLLLSLVLRVVPWGAYSHVAAANVLSAALLLASLAVALAVYAGLADDRVLLWSAALLLPLNSHLLHFGSIAMSEIPYLLSSLAALLALAGSRLDRPPWRDWRAIACALLAAASVYVRTMGVAVVAGVVLYLAWRRAWRHAAFVACVAVALVLPWVVRTTRLPGGGYVGQLLMVNPYQPDQGLAGPVRLAARVAANAWRYASGELAGAVLPWTADLPIRHPVAGAVVGLLVTAVTLWGAAACGARGVLPGFYAAATLGVLLLWPEVWRGTRFLVPLIPLLMFYFINGCRSLMVRVVPAGFRPWFGPLAALLVALLGVAPLVDARRQARVQYYPAAWDSYLRAAVWARAETPRTAVFSCRKPSIFAFFSDRRTTAYLFTSQSEAVLADLTERGVDYVVVDQLGYASTGLFLVPALQEYPGFFEEAHREGQPETYVFRVAGARDEAARQRLLGVSYGIRAYQESRAGDHAAALEHYRQAARIMLDAVPQPDSVTARTVANAGASFLSLGQADSALQWFEAAQAGFAGLGIDTTPSALTLLYNTAGARLRTGDTAGAVAGYMRVLEIAARSPAPGEPNAALSLLALTMIHRNRRRPAEEDRCRRQLLDRLSDPGLSLPQAGGMAYDVAAYYAQHGRGDDAALVLKRLADTYRRRGTLEDSRREQLLADLARFAAALGVAAPAVR